VQDLRNGPVKRRQAAAATLQQASAHAAHGLAFLPSPRHTFSPCVGAAAPGREHGLVLQVVPLPQRRPPPSLSSSHLPPSPSLHLTSPCSTQVVPSAVWAPERHQQPGGPCQAATPSRGHAPEHGRRDASSLARALSPPPGLLGRPGALPRDAASRHRLSGAAAETAVCLPSVCVSLPLSFSFNHVPPPPAL
jgi:hypothetical protein